MTEPADEGAVVLSLENVTRTYGDVHPVHALRSVSLDIHAGDFAAIVGPSGSGKSTMLGLLGCLDLPSSGVIRLRDVDVTTLGDTERSDLRGRTIGFVFQQFHLIPHLTAQANVETALLYRGLRKSDRQQRAFDALDRVGLGERADHRPVQLSGGEQQRVALARAIVGGPSIVLADEPTGALDTVNAAMVMDLLGELVSPTTAVIIVTHDLEIAGHASRKVSMRDGEIVNDVVQV